MNQAIEKKTPFWGWVGIIIVLLGAIAFQFYPASLSPNTHVLGDSPDGFRSHAAAVYHVRHDTSYWHTYALNYPYGDHYSYADPQPLITNSTKWISEYITDISDYTIGIIQGTMFFSLFLCGLFLYALFTGMGLPAWYSILVSTAITFLSPQIMRMDAHYGLAHAFVIPAILYGLYRWEQTRHWKWGAFNCIILILVSQLHFYLMAIGLALVTAYVFFGLLIYKENRQLGWLVQGVGMQIILPIIYLILWLKLGDDVGGRTDQPYGFFNYVSFWHTVFFYPSRWASAWMRHFVPSDVWITIESYAYIGVIATGFFVKEIFWRLIRYKKKKVYQFIDPLNRRFLLCILLAGIMVLFWSMGFPFVWESGSWLADYIGPLRQFRSLGRFAWVFFYVANVITFYVLYLQIKPFKRTWFKVLSFAFIIAFTFYECWDYTQEHPIKLHPHPEQRVSFQSSDHPWLDTLELDRYQAILPLPFYHIGSENIWKEIKGSVLQRSMWASTQTGLPIMASFMGRTSLWQTINLMEVQAEPYRVPKVLDDLPNQKPILILLDKRGYKDVGGRCSYMIRGLEPLYEDDHIVLYELPLQLYAKRIARRSGIGLMEMDSTANHQIGELLSDTTLANFVYDSFDDRPSAHSYRGGGAFTGMGGEEGEPSIFFDGPIPNQMSGHRYVFSAWYYLAADLHAKTAVFMEEYDPETKVVVKKLGYRFSNYLRSIDGDWALSDIPIYLDRSDTHIRAWILNEDLIGLPIWIDEFQLRSKDASLFLKTDTEFVRNNRWWPLPEERKSPANE